MTKQDVLNTYPDEEFLFADGFDDCIIGIDYQSNRVIYDINKCLDELVLGQKMPRPEAIDYFYFNTVQAFVGEQTPIWCCTTHY